VEGWRWQEWAVEKEALEEEDKRRKKVCGASL
jgi:hypothetical protein